MRERARGRTAQQVCTTLRDGGEREFPVFERGFSPRSVEKQGTDFSVVLFRSDFVLFSEKNHMKVRKNHGFGPCHILQNAFLEPQTEDKPWHLRYRSLRGDLTWDDPTEMWAYNFLRTKHFHEVSSASPQAYSLKSRYGKVREVS
jgi:hypothetical protein